MHCSPATESHLHLTEARARQHRNRNGGDGRGAFRAIFEMVQKLGWYKNPPFDYKAVLSRVGPPPFVQFKKCRCRDTCRIQVRLLPALRWMTYWIACAWVAAAISARRLTSDRRGSTAQTPRQSVTGVTPTVLLHFRGRRKGRTCHVSRSEETVRVVRPERPGRCLSGPSTPSSAHARQLCAAYRC